MASKKTNHSVKKSRSRGRAVSSRKKKGELPLSEAAEQEAPAPAERPPARNEDIERSGERRDDEGIER